MSRKEGFWEADYICSICGEHSSKKEVECPFCHSHMRNHERVINLCKRRDKDKCNEYCDGFDILRECYEE